MTWSAPGGSTCLPAERNFDIEKDDIIVGIMMTVCGTFAIIWCVWSLLSVLPSPAFHEHTNACYNEETLICGKEEGELYFTKSTVPNPLKVIDKIESARMAKHEAMTKQERFRSSLPYTALLLLTADAFIISLYRDKKKEQKKGK